MVDDEPRYHPARSVEATGGVATALAGMRARMDEAMGAIPLPDGVIAEPVVTQGVPGLLCRRAGANDDPYMLYSMEAATDWGRRLPIGPSAPAWPRPAIVGCCWSTTGWHLSTPTHPP